MNLKEFRAQYPQYNDLSDQDLAKGLHSKFYSDIPFDSFMKQVGGEQENGFFDMVGRAGMRGLKQTGSLLGDVLPAMVGKAVGADEYAARQMAEAAETQKEIQEKYAPRYAELSDVKGIGDALPFAAEVIAEQVPNILTSIIPGVGGAVIGGRVAAGQAAKVIGAREAGKEASEAAAKRYAAQATTTGAGRGALGGAFLGSYALNAPEIFQNIEQETGQMEVGASLLAGSVSAALDAILPAAIVKQFTPGMKAGVVEKILEKSGMPPGIARGVTAGVVTGAATEGPTEAAQEAISIAAEKFVQENPDVWGSKEFNRLVESGVRGAVGGGGISGVTGGVRGYMDRPREAPPETQGISSTKTTFDEIDAGEIDTTDVQEPPETFFDEEALSAYDQLDTLEPRKETPAAPTEDLNALVEEQKALKSQITETFGRARDLERSGGDPELVGEFTAYAQRLQEREREIRAKLAAVSEGPLQAEELPIGGPRRTFPLTQLERAVTEEQLAFAGFGKTAIKNILAGAKPEGATAKSKEILRRVAEGEVLVNNQLKRVTEDDVAKAGSPEERARLQAVLDRQGQQGTLFAPSGEQLSFDVTQPEGEVERNLPPSLIEMGEPEFSLERPEGVAPGRVNIEAPAETKGAPLKLVGKTPDRLFGVLRSLNPVAQAAAGVRNYRNAIEDLINDIREYINESPADQRAQVRKDINDFFDSYSLIEDPVVAADFAGSLKGKPPAEQSQLLKSRTKLPDLTKFAELNDFRTAFSDYMSRRKAEALGYTEEQAAMNTFATDARVPSRVSSVLATLRVLSPKSRSKEENAAFAYFSRWNYGLAMRSAAFDLGTNTPRNEMFSGQGAKQAALFKKYIEENFPESELKKFNATVDAYRYGVRKRYKNAKEQKERRQKIEEVEAKLELEDAQIKKFLDDATLEGNNALATLKPMHPAIQKAVEDGDLNTALDLVRQMPGANRYWSALATRLRELNLPTAIGVDKQRFLVEIELSQVEPSMIKLLDSIQLAYPDVYATYLEGATNDPKQLLVALQRIKDQNLIPATLTNDNVLFDLVYNTYAKNVPSLDSLGAYFINQDAINLNSKNNGLTLYGLFHETIHAATAHAIRNPEKLNAAQSKALQKLKDLYQHTMEKYPAVYEYGFRNLDEFIAEAFTNQNFQSKLRALKYENSDTSLWTQFIKFVSRMLGGNDSVLFATLSNADILMSATVPRKSYDGLEGTLNAAAPKSIAKGTFKTAPVMPDQKFAQNVLNSLLNRRDWSQAKGGVAQFLENISDTTRKYFLGAFTLRQLQDLIGTRLGLGGRNFILSVEGMLEEHNKIIDEAKKISEEWSALQSKKPQESKDTGDLMIDTTLAGVDPDTEPGKDADLDSRWNALSPEAKDLYRKVRDFYKRRMDAYKATLLNNIRLSLVASNASDDEIRTVLNVVKAKFEEDLVGPYFPLRRFGQYWINIGKGQDKGFYTFDTAAERNAARRLFEKESSNADFQDGNSLRDANLKNLQNVDALEEINNAIDKATDSVLNGKYTKLSKTAGSQTDTLRNAIKDSIQELYLLTLPTKSLRRNFIHRKGVSGASPDMLRAFSETASHMAYQHARFKFSRQMFDQLNAAEQVHKSNQLEGKSNTRVDGDYLNELYRRLDYVMNPTDTGTLPTILSNISFLWYLTAPASALVNMLGVPTFGYPMLASRFGKFKAAAMLSRTAKQFMTAGFKDKDGKFAMPSINMTDLSPQEQAAYEVFTASGLIDITQAYDLAGMAESPSNMYTGKMSTVMRWGSFLFHHAERFNREVMAMSTFKLAYEAAKKANFSDAVAFDKAINQAKDLTYRSMFDYSSLNKPRYLQNAYAKVILQFKQFPQHMTYLLTRSTYEWFSKDNPELREEVRRSLEIERKEYGLPTPKTEKDLNDQIDAEVNRIVKEGRGRLLGTLGMTFLFAGATGLPLFSVMSATIEALHAAFSDDDEPPLNFENWFKNWLAETFGDFAGDSISRGLVTQATGMNFADRTSLNDMWFRDPRTSQDEVTAFQNMVFSLLGPTASLGISAAEVFKLYNDGQYYRAAEKLLPAGLRQPLVAARYSTEGVLTLKGDELVSDISAKDALAQSLGFAPEKVAQRQKANIETKGMEQEIISKRQDLLNAFFMAYDTNNDDLRDRVLSKIQKFNQMYPTYPIGGETLTRSIKTRYKARALAELTGGMPLNKNLIGVLGEMGDYGG